MTFEIMVRAVQEGNEGIRNQIIDKADVMLKRFVFLYREKNLNFAKVTGFDDNMQNGRDCCNNCISKYDATRNTKFTTYFWDALELHFSNLRRFENAEKRKLNHIAESIIIKDDDSDEERIGDIPSNMHEVLFENLVVKEFLDSLKPKSKALVEGLLDGKITRSKGKLRQLKEVKKQFYKFFPEYKEYFYKKIFKERLLKAREQVISRRRRNVPN